MQKRAAFVTAFFVQISMLLPMHHVLEKKLVKFVKKVAHSLDFFISKG